MEELVDTYPWVLAVLFPVFWCGVLLGIGHLGGWARIASEYGLMDSFEGRRWRFQSGRFGWAHYGNCLTVGAGPRGLHFSVFVIFRPGHPPILVPWGDVSAKPETVLFMKYVDLRFRRVPDVRVRLSQRLATEIQLEAGTRWAGSSSTRPSNPTSGGMRNGRTS